MTLIFAYTVKTYTKYLDKKHFVQKLPGHTGTHTGPIALPGPPKWLIVRSKISEEWCGTPRNSPVPINYSPVVSARHVATPAAAAAAAGVKFTLVFRRRDKSRHANS